MADMITLTNQLTQTRNELNNLRKKMQALRAQHQNDIQNVKELMTNGLQQKPAIDVDHGVKCQSEIFSSWKPIGFLKTWFHCKNGTPRQGCVSSLSRGVLQVEKHTFNNPQHSLEGLQEYSHIWIFFVFDQNREGSNGSHSKSKVAPPRLNGERIGVFATRSPHRPNPLGLTLARLEMVKGDCLYLSGLDILDGTPIIDIKPYIPEYDSPFTIAADLGIIKTDISEALTVGRTSSSDSEFSISNTSDTFKYSDSIQVKEIYKKVIDINECTAQTNLLKQSFCDIEIPVSKKQNDKIREKTTSHEDSIIINVKKISHADDTSTKRSAAETCSLQKQSISALSTTDSGFHKLPVISDTSVSTEVKTATWLKIPPSPTLDVIFNPVAEKQMRNFTTNALNNVYRLEYLKDHEELEVAIKSILGEDPRSSYRRNKCSSQLYYFTVDTVHVTAWFDENVAEVLRVRPLKCVAKT